MVNTLKATAVIQIKKAHTGEVKQVAKNTESDVSTHKGTAAIQKTLASYPSSIQLQADLTLQSNTSEVIFVCC